MLCVHCVLQLNTLEDMLKEKVEFVDPEEYDQMRKSKPFTNMYTTC